MPRIESNRSDPSYSDIIHWDDNGRIVIIESPIRLAKELCPKVWQQKDIASFTRQMNIWRWKRLDDGKVTGRGSLSTRPSRWRHETLTRTSTAKEIAAVDRNVKSRTTATTTSNVSAFPETLDFSWADFSPSPETTPVSSPFQTPRAIPQYLIPQYPSLSSSPGSLSPSSPSSPVSPSSPTPSTPTSTPFQSPSPLFHQQQAPRAIATASSPSFFWGSPYLGPSSSLQTLSHVQTPRTIVPHTPSTILARGPSQLRQSYRPICEAPNANANNIANVVNAYPFDLHQLSLQGGVTAAEVEGLWGTGPF